MPHLWGRPRIDGQPAIVRLGWAAVNGHPLCYRGGCRPRAVSRICNEPLSTRRHQPSRDLFAAHRI